jgi:colanic acid biosynthesis glycosyl transferase WcaI
MNKRILLIGYNFYPEPTGIGKYSGEMLYWLAQKGYDCTVITTYPYYPYWKVQEPYSKRMFWYMTESKKFKSGGKMTVCRCPMYVPSKPSGIKRILLDFSFLASATFKLLQLLPSQKFDFVFVIAPSFQFGILGVLYKKIRKARFLYHIQDMQIEAARDLQLIKSKRIINFLFAAERYIFNNSDVISSISLGMIHKIREKANKNVLLFPNWTDTNIFYPIKNRVALKKDFGFEPTDKIVLYSGAIGEKQGLEAILQAADEFRLHKNLKFVICGSGPYKQKLQDLANALSLKNVYFLPLQPFDKFNQFLNVADVHLVIQKSNASDLVMPSKLTTILAVGGLALITADEDSSLYSLVEGYSMGLLVKPDDQKALNEGIQKAVSQDNYIITKNARAYAQAHLSIEGVMETFEHDINL